MKRSLTMQSVVCFALVGLVMAAETDRRILTVGDLLNLRSAGSADISPDGRRVTYTVSYTDFKQDASVSHIWLADTSTGTAFQLTQGEKSCSNPRRSPDSLWIAFTSRRIGDKTQLFVIRADGGRPSR